MKIIFLLLFIFCFNSWAKIVVTKIEVRGNTKTKDYIVLNECYIPLNQEITKGDIKRSVLRIKNLNLFSSVKAGIRKNKNNQTTLIYFVKEKWTTIPILNFSNGGGLKRTTVGIFDPNLFGRFIEGGVKYQQLGDQDSFSSWIKARRLTKHFGLDLSFSQLNRQRIKFDQMSDNPIIENSFIQNRNSFRVGFTHRYNYKHLLTFFYEYNKDRFPDAENITIQNSNGKNFFTRNANISFLGISLQSGKSLRRNELVNRNLFNFEARYGLVESEVADNFYQFSIGYNYAKSFGRRHNIVQRFLGGATDTQLLQHWIYLGGLDRIRGYVDNRFSGRFFWLSNTEYRYSAIKNRKIIAQLAAFVDIGNAKDQISDYANISGASAGLGIRLHLPQIYNFTLRFDYAEPLIKRDENQFSFGVRQFF